jgi:hypothetical protein
VPVSDIYILAFGRMNGRLSARLSDEWFSKNSRGLLRPRAHVMWDRLTLYHKSIFWFLGSARRKDANGIDDGNLHMLFGSRSLPTRPSATCQEQESLSSLVWVGRSDARGAKLQAVSGL